MQQVALEQPLLSNLLSYGTVYVYLVGGKAIILKNVPRPQRIRNDIEVCSRAMRPQSPWGRQRQRRRWRPHSCQRAAGALEAGRAAAIAERRRAL